MLENQETVEYQTHKISVCIYKKINILFLKSKEDLEKRKRRRYQKK